MPGVHFAARSAKIKDVQAYTVFHSIADAVVAGERVYIKNFGTFFSAKRKARTVISPQIPGGKADVPARKVIRFRPSPVLKTVMNGGQWPSAPQGEPAPAAKDAAPAQDKAKPVAKSKAAAQTAPKSKPAAKTKK